MTERPTNTELFVWAITLIALSLTFVALFFFGCFPGND